MYAAGCCVRGFHRNKVEGWDTDISSTLRILFMHIEIICIIE